MRKPLKTSKVKKLKNTKRSSRSLTKQIQFSGSLFGKSEEQDLQKIFSLIQVHAQVDPANYKLPTVSRRIHRQMTAHKFKTLAEYVKFLQAKPQEIKILSDDLFIHVTEFFRDPESFDALYDKFLPILIDNKTPRSPLRVWVPGCSTGEEPYSIAMLLQDYIAKHDKRISYQIFASDISEQAVEVARQGFYSAEEVKGISEARLTKYFDRVKSGYKIKKTIRDNFIFSRHDVGGNPPFAKVDLISCRNVLIYFDPMLQQRVLPVFHYALNDGGLLWLGKSEVPTRISEFFTIHDKTHKIYAKNSNASGNFHIPIPTRSFVERKDPSTKKPNVAMSLLDQQKEVDRIIIARYSPPGVVINSEMQIIQIRGHTAPYLELPSGQPSYNFLKMVRPELLPGIRMVVQAATKENAPVRKEGLTCQVNGIRKKVNVEVIPLDDSFTSTDRQFLVLFIDPQKNFKSDETKKTKRKAKVRDGSKSDDIVELLGEINDLREFQQHLTEGYEASQEELIASNEELQSTLEEFQSSNEELETAKEELQAANEELTTLNSELQMRAEALAASEERFRLLIEGVKDYAIFMIDPDGKVSTWNDGARRLFGFEATEMIGQNFSKLYSQSEINAAKPKNDIDTARTEGRYEEESVRIKKDGTKFFANIVISAIRDEAGSLRGFAKVTRDISERKVAEQALADSEERFRLMIEVVKDYGIFRLDTSGNIVTWNEGAKNLKGYETKEIVGKHFSIFYSKEDLERGKPAWELQQAINTGRLEDEGWRLKKDGSRFWANVVITCIRDGKGLHVGFTKVTRDLTQRKLAEEALKQSEARFRLIVESVRDYAIFMLDADGKVATWNEGAKRLKGYVAQEIVGKHFSAFFTAEDIQSRKPEIEIETAMEQGRSEEEGWRIRKDGSRFWANVILTKIIDSDGKHLGFTKVTRDLTERKMVEDKLRQSQEELERRVHERTVDLQRAVRAREEFISIASHELKTPLTALKLQAQITKRELERGNKVSLSHGELKAFADRLDNQVDRLHRLVEDMLDTGRIQRGSFSFYVEPCDLSLIVKDVVTRFSPELEKAGCEIRLELQENVDGKWDRSRIEQVVFNLLSNATKYGQGQPVEVKVFKKDVFAYLSVKDYGIGIAKEDQDRIFGRFERAIAANEVSGLGLGLFIVKEILSAHQGTIEVKSDIGTGSEFIIKLPVSPSLNTKQKDTKDYEF